MQDTTLQVCKLPDGDVYQGDMKDGKRHGWGIYTFHGGDVYEGQFRNNLRHGKGTMRYYDLVEYRGTWRNNLRHGFAGQMVPGTGAFSGRTVPSASAFSGIPRARNTLDGGIAANGCNQESLWSWMPTG